MTGLHVSTLALSVYNALSRHGSLTREQALSVLEKNWDPRIEASEVDDGASYLLSRQLVVDESGLLSPTHYRKGAARTLARDTSDGAELVFVAP